MHQDKPIKTKKGKRLFDSDNESENNSPYKQWREKEEQQIIEQTQIPETLFSKLPPRAWDIVLKKLSEVDKEIQKFRN